MLEIHDYKSGDVITTPCDTTPDSLYILVQGGIEVRVQSMEGMHSIHAHKPGDLANVIAFTGGFRTGICTSLHAVGYTQVLSLPRTKFEALIHTHPTVVYRFTKGLIRYVHSVMHHLNMDLVVLNQQINCSGIQCQMLQGTLHQVSETIHEIETVQG